MSYQDLTMYGEIWIDAPRFGETPQDLDGLAWMRPDLPRFDDVWGI